jgi:hypothetical protein
VTNVYSAWAILILIIGLVVAEELRVLHYKSEAVSAQELTAQCHSDSAIYQDAAAREITKRIEENEAAKRQSALDLAGVRRAYASRLDSIPARRLRSAQATQASATHGPVALSRSSVSDRRALDGTSERDELRRCFPRDRIDALIEEADRNAAKLLACQSALDGDSHTRR